MAILHRKEEKIQVVLGRLPKKYTHEQFVEMFIKLYSKDWGKIKSAYIKQSQDREPGTVVNMPKPDLYLKQVLETYLSSPAVKTAKETPAKVEDTPVVKAKATPKNKETVTVVDDAPVKKPRAAAKKTTEADHNEVAKKPKAVAKKAVVEETAESVKEVKKKAPAKKKVDAEEAAPVKEKKAKAVKK